VNVKFRGDTWNSGQDDGDDDDDVDEANKLAVVCKYYSKFPGMIMVLYGGEDVEVSSISLKQALNYAYVLKL
jgi:hypothetical protein